MPKIKYSNGVNLDNMASVLNNMELIEYSFQPQRTNTIVTQVPVVSSNTAYNKSVQALQKRAKKMFNNPKCSDTVFLVNQSKYFASSHLLTMASNVFDTLINTHYENCGDREIRIRNIKNDASFSLLLQYIYAVEMDFTRMNTVILCEVACLCETYGLDEFGSDLKCYLSNLEQFEIDTVVALLNTAQQFNLKALYKKLQVFAFQNAAQIVQHASFVNLQYAVLVDLLKSNWFYAPELEILQSVLIWHADKKVTSSHLKTPSLSDLLEEQEGAQNDGHQTNGCNSELTRTSDGVEMVSEIQAKDPDHLTSHINQMTWAENEDLNKTLILEENTENEESINKESKENTPTKESINVEAKENSSTRESINIETKENSPTKESIKPSHPFEQTVQTFTINILKSLLSHIRMTQISTLDFLKASFTEPCLSYKQFLFEYKLFSQVRCPRQNYLSGLCGERMCCPVLVRQFTVKSPMIYDKMQESMEECLIENIKWKLCLKLCKQNDLYCYQMFVKVTFEPSESGTTSCSGALCQLRLLPHQTDNMSNSGTVSNKCPPVLILPGTGVYKELKFNFKNNDNSSASENYGNFSASKNTGNSNHAGETEFKAPGVHKEFDFNCKKNNNFSASENNGKSNASETGFKAPDKVFDFNFMSNGNSNASDKNGNSSKTESMSKVEFKLFKAPRVYNEFNFNSQNNGNSSACENDGNSSKTEFTAAGVHKEFKFNLERTSCNSNTSENGGNSSKSEFKAPGVHKVFNFNCNTNSNSSQTESQSTSKTAFRAPRDRRVYKDAKFSFESNRKSNASETENMSMSKTESMSKTDSMSKTGSMSKTEGMSKTEIMSKSESMSRNNECVVEFGVFTWSSEQQRSAYVQLMGDGHFFF
uniref:BTB domain-containing protein n=1 Tax=Cacopsylla melanoneura TaxID=428564 RepID=A0A8D9AH17_9HEMI